MIALRNSNRRCIYDLFVFFCRGTDPTHSGHSRAIQLNSTPVSSAIESGVSKPLERKQAIVKPVLTHIIEGFHIQEALEPFPVTNNDPFPLQFLSSINVYLLTFHPFYRYSVQIL